MARKVYQFRYYGDGDNKNQPIAGRTGKETITGAKLRSGSIFKDCLPIKQLGIQTMPGVKFYLNNSIDPIIVGSTGIYELNVDNLTEITALNFDLTAINMINNNPSLSYIIVDILYDN